MNKKEGVEKIEKKIDSKKVLGWFLQAIWNTMMWVGGILDNTFMGVITALGTTSFILFYTGKVIIVYIMLLIILCYLFRRWNMNRGTKDEREE